jgi:hypothetical protein
LHNNSKHVQIGCRNQQLATKAQVGRFGYSPYLSLMRLVTLPVPVLLSLQTIYCRRCFVCARFLPYDDNYGLLLQAVFISMAAWVFLRMVQSKWLGPLSLDRRLFWTWLVAGSPLTFILALFNYGHLFGALGT